MPDTSHLHAQAVGHGAPETGGRTEGDGVSYRGIVWFLAILVATTVTCQLLMWGLFAVFERQTNATDGARAPMAMPRTTPEIKDGRLMPASPTPPPTLMVTEPIGLEQFRQSEDEILSTYGWVDKNTGTIRIPIDRAKALMLQRGFPVRGETPAPAAKPGKAPGRPNE